MFPVKILLILMLVIDGFCLESIVNSSRQCQCQCCQYMGPLVPNSFPKCPCRQLQDVGKAFPCQRSTPIPSARICRSNYQLSYDLFRPNLCCQLTFV